MGGGGGVDKNLTQKKSCEFEWAVYIFQRLHYSGAFSRLALKSILEFLF